MANNLGSPARRSTRMELRNPAGKTKAGKLCPILATPFLPGESGLINQQLSINLDPVAGRLISQTFARVVQVMVPVQACDRLRHPDDPKRGITEIIRGMLKNGESLFNLDPENELTKRMAINPVSISGEKRVCSIARIAHNAAVNHLRKRRYVYADLLEHTNTDLTPAIIAETVLERFGGALDPDEHINGNVTLDLSADTAPVKGIGVSVGKTAAVNDLYIRESGGTSAGTVWPNRLDGNGAVNMSIRMTGTTASATPDVFADLSAIAAGGFSLTDLYNAQKADELVRAMRQVADQNPEDGEDAVLRWAFGLSADSARHPWVVYDNRFPLGEVSQRATDGAGIMAETIVTQQANGVSWSVPIPATELGGILITFLQVTPDEVLDSQPHPIFSDSWTAVNHAAEQLRLDPEAVPFRSLFSDVVTPAEETAVKFYTGANALKKTYVDYGFNRQVDPDTVDAKTVLWQYAIPAGVTPENILYPENFSQYPFLDQNAEVVTYNLSSVANVSTPMFFGPTPVEKLAIVDTEGLLE